MRRLFVAHRAIPKGSFTAAHHPLWRAAVRLQSGPLRDPPLDSQEGFYEEDLDFGTHDEGLIPRAPVVMAAPAMRGLSTALGVRVADVVPTPPMESIQFGGAPAIMEPEVDESPGPPLSSVVVEEEYPGEEEYQGKSYLPPPRRPSAPAPLPEEDASPIEDDDGEDDDFRFDKRAGVSGPSADAEWLENGLLGAPSTPTRPLLPMRGPQTPTGTNPPPFGIGRGTIASNGTTGISAGSLPRGLGRGKRI